MLELIRITKDKYRVYILTKLKPNPANQEEKDKCYDVK